MAAGVMAQNVATYGYAMVAARLLGPQPYGGFASLMNTLLVVSVLQLGLQATAARRIAADPGHRAQVEHLVMRLSLRVAAGVGVGLVLAAPLIDAVLHLDSLAAAAMVGLCAVPMTVMGGQAGILQGERRWGWLALLYVANGVPRLAVGTALVLAEPGEQAAMLGVLLGMLAPVAVGAWALRSSREPGAVPVVGEQHSGRAVLGESLRNVSALLAFLALANVDLIVARNVLDGHDSGLYAAGLILTKAVLFLPQFLVVVSFPAMSTVAERRRALARSLAVAGGLGLLAIAGSAVLGDLAMIFVGGEKYAEVQSRLWLFAVVGTLLSMLQLLVYSVLARQGRQSASMVWLALVVVVVAGLGVDSIDGLLALIVVVDGVLLVAMTAVSWVVLRRPVEAAEA